MPAQRSPVPAPSLDALDDSALHFQRFAESSDDVFWIADLDQGRLLYVSPRFEHFWNAKAQALLEDPSLWRQAVLPEDAAHLPTPFFADDFSGESVREYRITGRDGQCHWIRDRRFQLRDEAGQLRRVGGIAEDITERKRVEHEREELLSLERQARAQAEALAVSKDEFLAVVTHELRSPLNAIRGWAHVLRNSGHLTALQIKALDAIDRNTQAQARMVDDLLDSQRIVSGDLQLDWGQPFLSSVIKEAVEAVQPQAQAKQIRVVVVHDLSITTVNVDVARMRQVLINLLSNAVKFTPEGGVVEVRSQRTPELLLIAIQDSGIGLEPDQLPLVFERFQQADTSNTRPQRGLGLGLSLARQLVQLHGGQIVVDSAGVGKGSTFTVGLPISLAGTPPHANQQMPEAPSLAGKRIMIVEDEDDSREALELILRSEHAELLSFNAAGSAYTYLAQAEPEALPDALISDIAMPREDGYQFIRRVRDLECQRERPRMLAMALTAFARSEDRERAYEAGFDVHLSKPIDSGIILQTLNETLRQPA